MSEQARSDHNQEISEAQAAEFTAAVTGFKPYFSPSMYSSVLVDAEALLEVDEVDDTDRVSDFEDRAYFLIDGTAVEIGASVQELDLSDLEGKVTTKTWEVVTVEEMKGEATGTETIVRQQTFSVHDHGDSPVPDYDEAFSRVDPETGEQKRIRAKDTERLYAEYIQSEAEDKEAALDAFAAGVEAQAARRKELAELTGMQIADGFTVTRFNEVMALLARIGPEHQVHPPSDISPGT